MKLSIGLVLVAILLLGCATQSQLHSLETGMTKDEVIETMGKPKSYDFDGYTHSLTYQVGLSDYRLHIGTQRGLYSWSKLGSGGETTNVNGTLTILHVN